MHLIASIEICDDDDPNAAVYTTACDHTVPVAKTVQNKSDVHLTWHQEQVTCHECQLKINMDLLKSVSLSTE
jgi:hypothetical protein